jgi:hypothetical protein
VRAGETPARRGVLAAWVSIGLALVTLAGAGCGSAAPDLFAVQRSGTVPGARLTLVVSDNGTVRCNGGPGRQLPDPELLGARQLQRDLGKPATQGVALAPGSRSVFTYSVTTPGGSVRFSDTSPGIQPVFQRLAAFTREVARGACGLPR